MTKTNIKSSHEDFAKFIIKYDCQVIKTGFYVNYKFPEQSAAYVPPDSTMTPERKYQEILAYLKEITNYGKG